MKKVLSFLSIFFLTCLVCLTSCKGSTNSSSKEGKVLNIYCWNTEFKDIFEKFYQPKMPSDIVVNFIITPNQNNEYQNRLDEALMRQLSISHDDRIDLFLIESDYVKKYVDTPYALDVKKEIGLSDANLAYQYNYTKDLITDNKKSLKGVSWQATPSGFIYRRSYAKEVLGTDDPEEVQKYLSNWDDFANVAKMAKSKGYFMLSGYDDSFRAFAANISSKWVKGNTIVIDPQIIKWIEMTKDFSEKNYNNHASLWSEESGKGMGKDGKVFGYFGPSWFIDYTMVENSLENADEPHVVGNGSFGDWAFCSGPQVFSWGGTWICGAAGTDNKSLVKDIMYTLTCDTNTMEAISKETGDFVNNESAMYNVANSNYQNAFLGGQNHIALFINSAKSIDKTNTSPYDQGITENLMSSMKYYYDNEKTLDQAWNKFYSSVLEVYPNLVK
ncbi:MAG: carbohydrate ABC transporter substrate-binding protein [Treponema sp.]|nr:carbohydrate ABC transporter substrate-binding protein [Treponema sp.]